MLIKCFRNSEIVDGGTDAIVEVVRGPIMGKNLNGNNFQQLVLTVLLLRQC